MADHTPVIDFPLHGEWLALRSPGHHRYAFDFAAVVDPHNRIFAASPFALALGRATVADSYSWAAPIYAPFDGVVQHASNGWPDEQRLYLPRAFVRVLMIALFHPRATPHDIPIFTGNYVTLQSGAISALLAHMRCSSLQVGAGQAVARGHVLGQVGNSGNSVAPHLHLQVMDSADFLRANIIPFRLH